MDATDEADEAVTVAADELCRRLSARGRKLTASEAFLVLTAVGGYDNAREAGAALGLSVSAADERMKVGRRGLAARYPTPADAREAYRQAQRAGAADEAVRVCLTDDEAMAVAAAERAALWLIDEAKLRARTRPSAGTLRGHKRMASTALLSRWAAPSLAAAEAAYEAKLGAAQSAYHRTAAAHSGPVFVGRLTDDEAEAVRYEAARPSAWTAAIVAFRLA